MPGVANLLAATARRQPGALAFTCLRMVMVFCVLLAALMHSGSGTLVPADWVLLILSGIIGIFIGDTALFFTLNRLCPRRTGILFSCDAPMTVFLAWWILDEQWQRPA
ncbi:EamA family transporter [Granulosicoccus sp. 3-233]|uniref:EamA family transporter n=1 Tax=Granulosicoccus sp. 3-233 TaxID=3417969 RepID=UPI003D33BBDC